MSETILRVLLSELETIRIKCKNCGLVYETTVTNLCNGYHLPKCAHCKTVWERPLIPDTSFEIFAKALKAMLADSSIEIEFVIPQPDKPNG
jgi:hypothetical protein